MRRSRLGVWWCTIERAGDDEVVCATRSFRLWWTARAVGSLQKRSLIGSQTDGCLPFSAKKKREGWLEFP
jgi:hypothetical protein